jgi:gliding motility-associated-like protein
MKRGGLVWLLVIFCLSQNIASAQNISNEGTDFWAVFPSHDPSNNNGNPHLANLRIYVTSKTESEVTITCGSFNSGLISVSPGVPSFVDVPRSDAYIDHIQSNTILSSKGIRIQVTPGKGKVAVYEHIYAGARSAASLILPYESLGKNYYSMNYTQDNSAGSRNFLVLVATEANTDLLIHHNNTIIPVSFTQVGEVYQFTGGPQEDITGTYVEVDPNSPDFCNKRFAAYSGSTSLNLGCTNSRDPLFQQLYPTSTWGKSYGIVPFYNRRHHLRILAEEDNTKVQLYGQTILLNKGEIYKSPSPLSTGSLVVADKRISVAQYSLTQNCSSITGGLLMGDPDMVLLNPIEFNIKSVTLFSSNQQNIVQRFINVFIKTSAAPTFRINGTPPSNGNWSVIPSNPEYSFIQVSIDDISSNLTASDGFNAVAYGFGSAESYAYSAGTNLATNNYLLVNNKTTNLDALSACLGQASDFKIILPAQATSLEWQLDNDPPVSGPMPLIPSNIINSPTGDLYEYTYAANITFNQVSDHTMTVKVKMQTLDPCLGNNDVFTYNFNVDPVPIAAFTLDKLKFCELEEVKFKDESNSLSPTKLLNKWLWDFGDNNTSEEQHPTHKYTQSGIYTVKLFAGVDDGCMSEVVDKTIEIISAPNLLLDIVLPVCINGELVTLHASETKGFVGDVIYTGKGVTNNIFNPQTAGLGAHTITYSFKNDAGCEDIKTQIITVIDTAKFDLEKDIYILKGGEKRLDIRAYGANATYKWSPSNGLDRDDILNPVIFSSEEDREYILTSVTDGNCTTTRKITVHMIEKLEPSNAFSPNSDGVNDVWKIKYIETYPKTTVQVFNRYGESVFFTSDYSFHPFDGHYKNQALPVGTYYYIIDPKNGKPRLTGPLTLIR